MKLVYVETDARAFTTHRKHLWRAGLAAGHDVHLIAPGSDSDTKGLREAGVVYHPLAMERGGMNPIAEAGTTLALARLYRRLRPDIVHHMALKSVLYGAAAARSVGVPAIVGSLTGLGYAFMPGGRRRRVLARGLLLGLRAALAARNVKTIVQNPDDRAFLLEQGVARPERVKLIYGSGVDTAEFFPAPEPEGPPIVLAGSRMLWDKGIGELVEACRLVRQAGASVRLVLAGDPDLQNPATISEAQLRAWTEQDHVEWRPHSGEMARLLRESTLACLPSYREGLPLFLAEAAASGRASITTDVPGCRSVVEHGHSGLIVPARETAPLAEAISKLLVDAPLRRQMGESARRLAEQRFSKEVVTDQIFAVYESLR